MSPNVEAAFQVSRTAEPTSALSEILAAEADISRMSDADRRELIERLQSQPNDGFLHLWHALVLEATGDFEPACEAFARAIDRGCNHWRLGWHIARAAKKMGQLDLVDQACAAVLKANPEFWFARELPKHARGYYGQGDHDEVIENFFAGQKPRQKFFVEVGAFDGVHYSNVRRLHERHGWTGLCIEPVAKNFQKLANSYSGTGVRCVRAAVANREGEAEIHVSTYPHLPDWGSDVATLSEKETARWSQYGAQWHREKVPARRLATLLDEQQVTQIDLLSIDAEGHDLEVLQTLDFARCQPQLIVIEYGRQREAIATFLAGKGYSLLLDNAQDLFLAQLQHGADASLGLPATKNYTGLTGRPPYEEIQRDAEDRLHESIRKPAAEVERIVIVGGYLGQEVHSFLAHYPKAEIHLFEPSRRYFSKLATTFAGHARVHSHNVAVGDEEGSFPFHEGSLDGVGSLLPLKTGSDAQSWIPENFRPAESYTVPVVTLDHFAPLHDRPIDLLWCDVQGAELKVLRGARKTLARTQALFLEVATTKTTYVGQCLLPELRTTLLEAGFHLAGIGLCPTGNGTGNALWLRTKTGEKIHPNPPPLATRTEIERKVNPHLLALKYLPLDRPVGRRVIPPEQLLTPQRFDLTAKFLYAKHRTLGVAGDWAKQLYAEHIRAITAGACREDDGSKSGLTDYLGAFDRLLDSIQTRGFDEEETIVPAGRHDVIIDGAHRVAASLLYKQPVTTFFFDREANNYGHSFFLKRGLDRNWCDVMALEYCRLRNDTRLVIVFPSAQGRDEELRAILGAFGEIVYEKSVSLNHHGALNLIKHIYLGETWLGNWFNDFAGAAGKAKPCFRQDGPVRAFLFQCDDPARAREAKTRVRELFSIGHHSVHINDTHEETIRLAQALFNDNSVAFLNSTPADPDSAFSRIFHIFLQQSAAHGWDREQFCLFGEAVRTIHGLGGTQKIDCLHFKDIAIGTGETAIRSGNERIEKQRRDEIIFNPAKHFYFMGVKCAILNECGEANQPAGRPAQGSARQSGAPTIHAGVIDPSTLNDRDVAELCGKQGRLGLIILWPAALAAGLGPRITESLAEFGRIRHRRRIALTTRGQTNLLTAIHEGKPWWEKHLAREVLKRFPTDAGQTPTEVVLFEYEDVSAIRRWKNEFRPTLGLEKSSFHVADPDCPGHLGGPCTCSLTDELLQFETRRHARLLLNRNSIHFLNHHIPGWAPLFENYFASYRTWIREQGIDPDSCCVTTGGVLAAYGIRDSQDLDFISAQHHAPKLPNVDCHNEHFDLLRQSCDLPYSIYDLLSDPANHFYYRNHKFISLPIIQRVKETRLVDGRRREKDIRDAALTLQFLNDAPPANAPATAKSEACAPAARLVGLVPARNEGARIAFCLRALACYTDAIVYLDDCSDDDTLQRVESLAHECRVERIIRKSTWHRDEPADRNALLKAGREIGGTHFIVLDADEAFTANCATDDSLRQMVLGLQPGDQLALNWIQLWRGVGQYRFDRSVWTWNAKAIIFCDDGQCSYSSEFIHTPRVPGNLAGRTHSIPGYTYGLLHFQFVNWRNLLVKQAWYRCLERLRDPQKPVHAINERYAPSKDERELGLKPAPANWLAGYPFFDGTVFDAPDAWREEQVLGWFQQYGKDHFQELDIWDVDWDRAVAESGPAATEVFPKHAARDPQTRKLVEACLDQAEIRFNAGDIPGAREYLSRAVDVATDEPDFLLALGRLDFQLGDFASARTSLVSATALRPDDASTHAYLATVCLKLEKFDEFETALARALQLNPDEPCALRLLADLNFQNERFPDAAKLYGKILTQTPDDVDVMLPLGKCLFKVGDAAAARLLFERILELQPGHEVAVENLGVIIGQGAPGLSHTASGSRSGGRAEGASGLPLVTAIVSTYNSESFLRGCLEDLEAQTIADRLEIIVVDSGSPQNEAAIVREFQQRFTNIKYVRTGRETLYAAWNRAIRMANGKYLASANTDDRHRPDAFAILTRELEQNPNVHLVYGDCYLSTVPNESFAQNAKTKLLRYPDFFAPSALLHFQFGPQMMWRKSVHDRIGFFDEDFKAVGDYEFNLRYALQFDARHIHEPLGLYLSHPGAISFRDDSPAQELARVQTAFRTPETIGALYRKAGADCATVEARARNFLDMGVRALRFFPGWMEGTPASAPEFALNCFELASELQPAWAAPYNNMAVALACVGQGQGALKLLQQLAVKSNDSSVRHNLELLSAKPDVRNLDELNLLPSGLPFPAEQQLSARATERQSANSKPETQRPIRLLLVAHNFLPHSFSGTEVYTLNLAQEFRRRGHDVRVLYPAWDANRPEGSVTEDVYEGLPVARMNLRQADQAIHEVENPAVGVAFGRYLATQKLDLVHFQHLIGFTTSALVACQQRGLPVVLTAHDTFLLCHQLHLVRADGSFCARGPETVDKCVQCLIDHKGELITQEPELFQIVARRRKVLREALNHVDTLVVHSKFIGRTLAEHRLAHPSMVQSPLGLHPMRTVPAVPRSDTLRFTFVGNIYFTKGLDLVVQAFNAIDARRAHLHIYGGIVDRAYFDSVMAQAKPDRKISYHGSYQPETLPEILAHTDVVVLGSRAESFSLVVREAFQAGVTVIAPEVGGVPEIVVHGVNGLLFQPNNANALAEQLRYCVEDFARVDALRRNVPRVLAIAENADQLERIYAETMKASSVVQAGENEANTLTPEVDALLKRAASLCGQNGFLAARDLLRQGMAAIPESFELRVALGTVLFQLKDWPAAQQEFVKGTRLRPNAATAHASLAAVQLQLGHLDLAEASIRSVLELEPMNREALKFFATLCFQQDRFVEAARNFTKVLEQSGGDLDALLSLGACFYKVGDLASAQMVFEQALTVDPSNAIARENISVVQSKLKSFAAPVPQLALAAPKAVAPAPVSLGEDNKYERIPCPFCGNRQAEIFRTLADIVKCGQCETVYLRTRFKTQVMEQLYQNYADDGNHMAVPKCDDQAATSGLRRDYFLKEILSFTQPKGRILDVGCGWGAFLLNARDHGFDPTGVELTRKAVQYANERLGIPTVNTQFLDTPYEAESLQVVTMLHVLEHLPQPKQAMEKIFHALKPGGVFCGIVPNVDSFCSQQQDDEWFWLDPNYHYVHYSPATLKKHLEEAGFKVERVYTSKGDYDLNLLRQVGQQKDPSLGDDVAFNQFVARLETEGQGEEIRFFARKPGTVAEEAPRLAPVSIPSFTPVKTKGLVASIIIPLFNTVEYTQQCLRALAQNTGATYPFEVILVDNASTDGTVAFLEQAPRTHPFVRVIRNAENLGFGKACNLGAEAARGKYLVFLNNDTEPQQRWLEHGIARLEQDATLGIVGSKLLYPDRTIQHCGIEFFREVNPDHAIWPLHRYRKFHENDPMANHAGEVPAVTGACLFIERKLFTKAGGFSPEYKMYFEDTDLCFKVREQGRKIFYEPRSVVIHHEGKSSANQNLIDSMNKESADIFFRKWEQALNVFAFETAVVRREGKYHYLAQSMLPALAEIEFSADKLASIAKSLAGVLESVGPFYLHVGGAGDALLLLSTFYDKHPKSVVVSFANSIPAAQSLFEAFPKLEKVYFLPPNKSDSIHLLLRMLMRQVPNCRGMGATPEISYQEWNATLNIFQKYGVIQYPRWAQDFKSPAPSGQIVLAPQGSQLGMIGSKRNIIHPDYWAGLIDFLRARGFTPVILGTPGERTEYPSLPGCLDRRSYSFREQMESIASSALFIGADSWGKSFSALAKVPTIVFEPLRGGDWKGIKDASDFVFLDRWESITKVKTLDECKQAFAHLVAKHGLNPAPVAPAAHEREESPTTVAPPLAGVINVAWEGTFLDHGSLSHVNRELTAQLRHQSSVKLTCVGKNVTPSALGKIPSLPKIACALQAQAAPATQVTVRHEWPPRWHPPKHGAWVLIQPWEFGSLPAEWVKQIKKVDEIWAPSEYVRRVYVESGVPETKVHIVPNGVNPELFHPQAPPMALATKRKFKFLFVGGTIFRKGPEILLKAYLDNFTAADDVCLVIKDFGGQSVYAGQTFEKQIKAAQSQKNAPEILYLTDDFAEKDIAGLYVSCDCLVHPYRGEGFGLPVLEAMACGLPVVVTGGGATDDFATDEFAYRVAARRAPIGHSVSGMRLAGEGWVLEPDVAAFGARMKWIFTHREEARAKGRAASDYARREWSWEKAAQTATARLQSIVAGQTARPSKVAVPIAPGRGPTPIQLPAAALLGQLKEATALFQQRKFLPAWNATLAAIQARPFHPEAYLLLAQIAQAAGDIAQARLCTDRSRQLAPQWKPAKKFSQTLPAKASPKKMDWPPLPDAKAPPRLSVCLITKNEEKFLDQCLASVRGLAHQIVVVDTGSTDRTIEIAKQHGAEVYHCDWVDDFSAARNVSLQHATGDWILVLDADEELLPESRAALLQEMQNSTVMAWRLPMIDKGREAEGHSFVPRLFRNAPALFYVGRVHEQVFSSIEVRRKEWGLENKLGTTELLHHGYVAAVVKDRNKVARNLRLLELAIAEMPDEPNLLMNLGLELVRSNRAAEGLERYQEAFRVMSAQPRSHLVPELRETLLSQLCTQLMNAKNCAEVVRVLQSPLARAGGLTASQHFALGLAFMELRQFREAAEQMKQCLIKRHQPCLSPVNVDIKKAGPNHCLALCLATNHQPAAAEAAFRKAMADDPSSRGVAFDYAQFLDAQKRPLDALKVLNQIISEKADDAATWQFGGRIALSNPAYLKFANDWTGEAIKNLPQDETVVEQRAQALLLFDKPAESLPLWRQIHLPTNACRTAALVLCETVAPAGERLVTGPQSPQVSQEFVRWYQRLIQVNATQVVETVNKRLNELRHLVPEAATLLEAALVEAGAAPRAA